MVAVRGRPSGLPGPISSVLHTCAQLPPIRVQADAGSFLADIGDAA